MFSFLKLQEEADCCVSHICLLIMELDPTGSELSLTQRLERGQGKTSGQVLSKLKYITSRTLP